MVDHDEEGLGDAVPRAGMNREEYFTCPCCGQKAPLTRLTKGGPYEFEMWNEEWGGKMPLTEDERIARRGQRFGRGSAPGNIKWSPAKILKRHRDAIANRLSQLLH
jgi:hypothetical protein